MEAPNKPRMTAHTVLQDGAADGRGRSLKKITGRARWIFLAKLAILPVMTDIVYDFQWDAVKAVTNANKHGVTFEQAATVFLDPLALTILDETHSQDEERWWLLGHDASGVLLLVAHTYQTTGAASANVRIISARPATKREQQFYENEPK
jgi:uncharacterized DUF497 family protein